MPQPSGSHRYPLAIAAPANAAPDPTLDTRRSILLIEDEPDQQLLTTARLEIGGHRVQVVATMHDALDLLAVTDARFDVVIVDLNLPDHEGPDSLELLRATTSTPLVVYSSAPRSEFDRARGLGATECVEKTASTEVLLDAVEAAARVGEPGMGPLPVESRVSDGENDFASAARAVVEQLADSSGIGTWLVTRVVGDDWIILAVADDDYGLEAGDVLRWSDSFCSRMVDGRRRVVADTATDPVYADAPIGQQIDIGAYVGMPLAAGDAGLFGTLCGISPAAHPDPGVLEDHEPMLEALAQVLSCAVAIDLERARLERRLEMAELAARSDLLTGLGNRRAWDRALRNEDARCERFGHRAGVVIIDLDGLKSVNDTHGHDAGDRLIRRAATVLAASVRDSDQAFRIGGDEFAVLLPETGEDALDQACRRIGAALGEAGVSASLGSAVRGAGTRLAETARRADEAMYAAKESRRAEPRT